MMRIGKTLRRLKSSLPSLAQSEIDKPRFLVRRLVRFDTDSEDPRDYCEECHDTGWRINHELTWPLLLHLRMVG